MSTRFEVSIYNQSVRDLVRSGKHHDFLADVWADLNFVAIRALDENDARRVVERRYPAAQGYVVSKIFEIA